MVGKAEKIFPTTKFKGKCNQKKIVGRFTKVLLESFSLFTRIQADSTQYLLYTCSIALPLL